MGYQNDKLSLMHQTLLGRGKHYFYMDTGGEATDVYEGAGYFANAGDVGADTGDHIFIYDKNSKKTYQGYFTTVQDTGATQGTVVLDTGALLP